MEGSFLHNVLHFSPVIQSFMCFYFFPFVFLFLFSWLSCFYTFPPLFFFIYCTCCSIPFSRFQCLFLSSSPCFLIGYFVIFVLFCQMTLTVYVCIFPRFIYVQWATKRMNRLIYQSLRYYILRMVEIYEKI